MNNELNDEVSDTTEADTTSTAGYKKIIKQKKLQRKHG